ncbi:MAG: hypothetical protein ABIP42_02085, partial [Planctomycetota bacterium]
MRRLNAFRVLAACLVVPACTAVAVPEPIAVAVPERGAASPVQRPGRTYHGPSETYFGRTVASVPDCDGDGIADYCVGMGFADAYTGAIRIFSSITHEALFTIRGGTPEARFGAYDICPTEDMDGDGLEDLLVGLGRVESATELVSTAQRKRLYRLEANPSQLLACLDLNGDRKRDWLSCTGDTVEAFDGMTGEGLTINLPRSLSRMIPARVLGTQATSWGVVLGEGGRATFYDCLVSLEK